MVRNDDDATIVVAPSASVKNNVLRDILYCTKLMYIYAYPMDDIFVTKQKMQKKDTRNDTRAIYNELVDWREQNIMIL